MNLREIRRERNMSQSELAKLMGVKQSSVSCWESGTYSPNVDSIRRLTGIFNCTSDELLGISIPDRQTVEHRA